MPLEQFEIKKEDKELLLAAARESIRARLEERPPEYSRPSPDLEKECGAFVTLHKNGELRGCIGQIYAVKPLFETIKSMAISSAFQDPRFPPLRKEELPLIEIEISVLSPLEEVDSTDKIKVGTHGIYIKKGYNSGLLLPQVAVEQKWDLETFLTHTCYKAGLGGNCWKDPETEIYIFSAGIFKEGPHGNNKNQ